MMTLGGGRAIVTLRAADRDRGNCYDCQKSWEVIVGSDLLSLHSCLFTLQVAERGSWQAVVITCKTCLLQSMIRTNISGQCMSVVRMCCGSRPDVMFVSAVCLSLRESGQEKRATCTLGEIRMRLTRMRMCATRHQEMCATCGEGSLQQPLQKGSSRALNRRFQGKTNYQIQVTIQPVNDYLLVVTLFVGDHWRVLYNRLSNQLTNTSTS